MKKWIVLIVVFISTKSFSQVKINEELKTLINQSFAFFPKIKEVENTIITAEENLKSVRLNKMPEIDAAASYNYLMPKISFPIGGKEVQFAPVNNFSTTIGGSYMLFDFGRMKATIAKAKAAIAFTKHDDQFAKQQLANQITTIYYNIIYLQKAIAVKDSVINYLRENKNFVANKAKNGDMLELDVLNLQAYIDDEENKKLDLTTALEKQFNLLEYTTGGKNTTGQVFDFNIENTDATTSPNNAEIALSIDKITQANKELEIVKLNHKPSVGIHAGTGFKNGFVPEVNDMRFNYLAGISFNIPIYNFGKNKQQIKVQESIVKQATLNQVTIISNNKKDLEQANIDIKSNTVRIKNVKSQVDASIMTQKITTSRFKNGVATYLDVEAAATNVQKALLSQLQYEYQLCLAKLEWARIIGFEYWK